MTPPPPSPTIAVEAPPAPTTVPVDLPPWRFYVILAVAALFLPLCFLGGSKFTVSRSGVTLDLPVNVGQFWGTDEPVSAVELEALPKDTRFARKLYHGNGGEPVLCSIVLSGGEQNSIHRPEVCLPSQGWTIDSSETIPIKLKSGRTLNVTELSLSQMIQVSPTQRVQIRSLYDYWFVGDGVTTPSHWRRVWEGAWDKILYNRKHRWAYVIATAKVGESMKKGGDSLEKTRKILDDFIRDAVPSFQISEMEHPEQAVQPPSSIRDDKTSIPE